MNKLYYSDGREVKNGDVVKDADFEPYDEYDNGQFYIGVHEDHYSLSTGLGNLGQIDSVEGFELVERHESSELEGIIDNLSWLNSVHQQDFKFEQHITKALDELRRAKKLIR
jgi:hypothetical protein